MKKLFNVYAVHNDREMLVVVNGKESWHFKKAVNIAEKFTSVSKIQTRIKEVEKP